MTQIKRAMILAAGLGTRLKPFTDKHPKALAPVNGKSLLQRNVEYLQGFGIREIMVNVHHFAGQIIDETERNNGWGSTISISDETGEVLETGGGIVKAKDYFFQDGSPFLVMNVDILTTLDIEAMAAYHSAQQALVTLAVTQRSTSRYLLFNDRNFLCGWTNESTGEVRGRAGTKKAFSGVHIIEPALFDFVYEEGKFSMIDLYLRLCQDYEIAGYDHTGDLLQDVGKPESILKAEALFP